MREADAWELVESVLREVAEIDPDLPITGDTLLFGDADLGIDSLVFLELLRIIENRTGIDIDDSAIDLRAPWRVRDLVDAVVQAANRSEIAAAGGRGAGRPGDRRDPGSATLTQS